MYYQAENGTFTIVPTAFVQTYYLNRNGPRKDPVKAFPPGLRMLAGVSVQTRPSGAAVVRAAQSRSLTSTSVRLVRRTRGGRRSTRQSLTTRPSLSSVSTCVSGFALLLPRSCTGWADVIHLLWSGREQYEGNHAGDAAWDQRHSLFEHDWCVLYRWCRRTVPH